MGKNWTTVLAERNAGERPEFSGQADDLDDLTAAELKALADDLGIEGTGSMRKAELRAAIEAEQSS